MNQEWRRDEHRQGLCNILGDAVQSVTGTIWRKFREARSDWKALAADDRDNVCVSGSEKPRMAKTETIVIDIRCQMLGVPVDTRNVRTLMLSTRPLRQMASGFQSRCMSWPILAAGAS